MTIFFDARFIKQAVALPFRGCFRHIFYRYPCKQEEKRYALYHICIFCQYFSEKREDVLLFRVRFVTSISITPTTLWGKEGTKSHSGKSYFLQKHTYIILKISMINNKKGMMPLTTPFLKKGEYIMKICIHIK